MAADEEARQESPATGGRPAKAARPTSLEADPVLCYTDTDSDKEFYRRLLSEPPFVAEDDPYYPDLVAKITASDAASAAATGAPPSEASVPYVIGRSSTSDNENEVLQAGAYLGLLSELPFVGRFNDTEDHRRAAADRQRAAGDSHRLWLDKKYKKRRLKKYEAKGSC